MYLLTDEDLDKIKIALLSSDSYLKRAPKGSIMDYERICSCDSGYFCEHRLKWLIDFIKSKGQ